jgi:hypothetical protein
LPLRPPGWEAPVDLAAGRRIRKIELERFDRAPIQQIQNSLGFHGVDPASAFTEQYVNDTEKRVYGHAVELGYIPPRTSSGILTMAGFLAGPFAGKLSRGFEPRTMAARYFVRLLCMQPDGIVLDPAAAAIHTPFIPQVEKAAKDHLDPKKGCYGCHVNLDPLASILSNRFQSDVSVMPDGELNAITVGRFNGPHYGIRGLGAASEGAFLGKKVKGISQLADILAESNEFNQCVVNRAFGFVFGREPTLADVPLVKKALGNFKSSRRYNQLVKDLVASDLFERSN